MSCCRPICSRCYGSGGRMAEGMAVPPTARPADHPHASSAAPALPPRRALRDRQARLHAHAAARLRHASSGAEVDIRVIQTLLDTSTQRRSTRALPSRRSATSRARSLARAPALLKTAPSWRPRGRRRLSSAWGGISCRPRRPSDRPTQKVVSAIRACRTAALGGHVARCDGCGHVEIGYNSCRNRHCPKCQGFCRARLARQASSRSTAAIAYYHVVFTPAAIARRFPKQGGALRPAQRPLPRR